MQEAGSRKIQNFSKISYFTIPHIDIPPISKQ